MNIHRCAKCITPIEKGLLCLPCLDLKERFERLTGKKFLNIEPVKEEK